MATFYIQLENKLLQISGELTAENIFKAIGYVPADSSTLSNYATKDEVSDLVDMSMVEELSQRVDNISFENLKDNPFLSDGSGELNIVDESGNIIAKIDSEGIHSIDFVAGDHKLSDKADTNWVTEYVTKTVTDGKVDLTGYATEQWVEDKNYLTEHQDISHLATKEEVADVDFFDIKNNPITNAEEGNLIFVDESGNIGLKLDSDNNLTVKDVIAGDNILSNKVDKENGKGLSTEDFTTALKNKLQSLTNYDDTSITEAVNSLRADFDTLVSGDTSTAIKTFNEIIAFLEGVEDTESLSGIIASIEQQIANIEIPSLDGYATEDYVNQKEQAIQTWVNNKAFATQEDVANIDFYEIKDNPIVNDGDGKLIFADENGNIGLQLEADNTLYVKDVISGDNILSNKADKSDLEGLATESYVVTKITEAKLEGSDIVIPVQDVKVNGQTVIKDMVADIDLTPYAKSEDVPSIEGLATEQWVTDKNYLTEHQDISHLASTEYVDEQIANIDVTEQLKDYALKSELPVNVSELNNDKGYLTEHQDISHLATKEELDTKDFYEIHNNPIVNDGDGKLVFVDENGNIGLQLEADNTLYVKDVVAGDDVLSNKMDITDNLVRVEDTNGELDDVPEDVYVKYVTQSLTEEQKIQTIRNIGAQEELVSGINIRTINGKSIVGEGDIEIKEYDLSKIVDLGIFMGQSNMAGRGVTTTAHPEPAPTVPEGHGYEFKAISDPTKLYNLVEPFGVKENNPNGVTETNKTGSMVAAFANAYYKYTHTPMVGVSCSKGGSAISQWQPGTAYLNDAISRYNTAKTWLIANGYTIRRSFMVWCQGEADSGLGTPESTYISQTKNTIEEMMKHGVEVCFVVRIGHYNKDYSTTDTDKDNNEMIRIQTEFCRTYKNAVMVSTDFAGMLSAGLMKDDQHYLQEGYNITGTNAGEHAAFYINTGIEPYMYDVQYDNVYFPYAEVASKQPEYDVSLNEESENAITNKAVSEVIKNINFLIADLGERLTVLEDAGTVDTTLYMVSNNLTNVISSNDATKIAEGRTYNAIITPRTNFIITSVQVLMNDIDVTASCYSGQQITVPNVNGNIVIIAVAEAIPMLELDFTTKSLDEYIADGVVSKNGEISSTHTAEGDKFTAVDSANLVLGKPLTFPTNFEIYLRIKTGEDFNNRYSDTNTGGGLALFNANGNRPMINLRNEFDVASPYEGMALQSRLVSTGGDTITITDVTVPTNDNIFHDVILHYENKQMWMSVDGVKSKVVSQTRKANTVTHLLGYTNYYRPDNVTIACLKVYEI